MPRVAANPDRPMTQLSNGRRRVWDSAPVGAGFIPRLTGGASRTRILGCQAQSSQSIGTDVSVGFGFCVADISRERGARLIWVMLGDSYRLLAPVGDQVDFRANVDLDPKVERVRIVRRRRGIIAPGIQRGWVGARDGIEIEGRGTLLPGNTN